MVKRYLWAMVRGYVLLPDAQGDEAEVMRARLERLTRKPWNAVGMDDGYHVWRAK